MVVLIATPSRDLKNGVESTFLQKQGANTQTAYEFRKSYVELPHQSPRHNVSSAPTQTLPGIFFDPPLLMIHSATNTLMTQASVIKTSRVTPLGSPTVANHGIETRT